MKIETQFKVLDVKFAADVNDFHSEEYMNNILNQLNTNVTGQNYSVIKDDVFDLTDEDVANTLEQYIPEWITGYEYIVYDPSNMYFKHNEDAQ